MSAPMQLISTKRVKPAAPPIDQASGQIQTGSIPRPTWPTFRCVAGVWP
jgi:hypothetical protein